MNLRQLLLLLSLLGNLTAATLWWRFPLRGTAAPDAPRATAPAMAAAVVPAASPPSAFAWQDVAGADLPTLVQALRRAGFPPTVIRAVAQARADAELRALKVRLHYPPETEVYWLKPEKPTKEQADAVAARQLALTRQIDDLLRDMEADSPAKHEALTQKHGPYSPAKLAALERIERDYEDIRLSRLSHLRAGPATPEIQAAFALLEQERMADIAAVLSPDEHLDYRLRHSGLASSLRYNLSPLNLSEAEFRTLFRAAETSIPESQAMEATFFGLVAQDRPEFAAPRAALLAQLETTLPPERFADLQQMFNPSTYRERLLVSRLKLPLSTVQRVHDLRVRLETIADPHRADLAPDRQAELTTRENALRGELQTLLGPEGYAGFQAAFPARPPAANAAPGP